MSRPVTLPLRLASQCTRQQPRPLYHQIQARQSSNPRDPKPHHHQPWPSPRLFSSTTRRAAAQKAVKPQMQNPGQPSIARQQKEQQAKALASGHMPEDLGLLPDTFILPRNLSERWTWRLRKKWISTRFWEFSAFVAAKYIAIKPRPKLGVREIPSVAKSLHAKVFTAFASGDLVPAQPFIASGLLSSLRARLAQRAPNTFLDWRIARHISSPRLVSYKFAQFPGAKHETKFERNAQMQAVVRLHTLQVLQNIKRVQERDRLGRLVVVEKAMHDEQTKETWENVVVQKTLRKGRWGEWVVWGFADETTLAKLDQEASKQASKAVEVKRG